ncbi:MAG: DUF4403 family protein [Gammaproteobacteria bacterium]|nr:MAG: DUF4403 family protein [Gammaproteobacteria bacterium]
MEVAPGVLFHYREKSMKIAVLKTLLALSVLAFLGAVGFLMSLQSVSETENKPKRIVTPINLKVAESNLSIRIKTPHPPLREASRQSLPKFYRDITEGPKVCAVDRKGDEICEDSNSEFTATSKALVLGVVSDDGFYVTVPFVITGKLITLGDSTESLLSFSEPFSARVIAYSKVTLSIDSDWCVRSTVSPNFKWIEGGEIRGRGIKVKLKRYLELKLTKLLEEMGEGVATKIQCDSIRQQVKDVWRTQSFSLEIPDNMQSQYINIQPTTIGFSKLKLESGFAEIDLNVSAKADISTKAIISELLPIPKSRTVSHKTSAIDLSLFYQVPYRKIVGELSDLLVGQQLSSRTRFGTYSLSVKSIEVYPFKDQLTIGLLVDSGNSEEWFPKSNWVYLLVRPKSDLKTGNVRLSFQKFAGDLDQGLSLAVNETVVPIIKKLVLADFKQPVDSTKDAITRVLEHGSLVQDIAEMTSMRIEQTTLTRNSVLIEIVFSFESEVEVELKQVETNQKQSDKPTENTIIKPMILYDIPDIPE